MALRKLLAGVALAAVAAQASADQIFSTIPGADFAVPGVIGTFNYALPAGSIITYAQIISPVYSFPAAGDAFSICYTGEAVFGLCGTIEPSVTSLFISNPLDVAPFPLTGAIELTVECLTGPCPSTFTYTPNGNATWILGFDFQSPTVPEPATLALLGLALAGLGFARRRKLH